MEHAHGQETRRERHAVKPNRRRPEQLLQPPRATAGETCTMDWAPHTGGAVRDKTGPTLLVGPVNPTPSRLSLLFQKLTVIYTPARFASSSSPRLLASKSFPSPPRLAPQPNRQLHHLLTGHRTSHSTAPPLCLAAGNRATLCYLVRRAAPSAQAPAPTGRRARSTLLLVRPLLRQASSSPVRSATPPHTFANTTLFTGGAYLLHG
ncbi:hypothetical protein E2562_014299 [Oryza meyeriana var. granulata]|uniref:Uncharacterized protein n=1 Tax=Oryza meyeriana var. granulata TaxID=110450 RepID=A0A6G1C672_9ORYZ|nr:hypothetical protein E2562_014299 [Oryza meyeriana var. granulata]